MVDDPNADNLSILDGINNEGDIVGTYYDSHGYTDGFLALPALLDLPAAAFLAVVVSQLTVLAAARPTRSRSAASGRLIIERQPARPAG